MEEGKFHGGRVCNQTGLTSQSLLGHFSHLYLAEAQFGIRKTGSLFGEVQTQDDIILQMCHHEFVVFRQPYHRAAC